MARCAREAEPEAGPAHTHGPHHPTTRPCASFGAVPQHTATRRGADGRINPSNAPTSPSTASRNASTSNGCFASGSTQWPRADGARRGVRRQGGQPPPPRPTAPRRGRRRAQTHPKRRAHRPEGGPIRRDGFDEERRAGRRGARVVPARNRVRPGRRALDRRLSRVGCARRAIPRERHADRAGLSRLLDRDHDHVLAHVNDRGFVGTGQVIEPAVCRDVFVPDGGLRQLSQILDEDHGANAPRTTRTPRYARMRWPRTVDPESAVPGPAARHALCRLRAAAAMARVMYALGVDVTCPMRSSSARVAMNLRERCWPVIRCVLAISDGYRLRRWGSLRAIASTSEPPSSQTKTHDLGDATRHRCDQGRVHDLS